MSYIHFVGECMVELRRLSDETMSQSFSGDVYNSAVYLKRCFPQLASSVVTAIGSDSLSDRMFERFEEQSLHTDLVFRHETRAPGLYYIETDEAGEKQFTYWRSESAARTLASFLEEASLALFGQEALVFVSGISLAVIDPATRDTFWSVLRELKASGAKIAFDPNYRARLWESPEQAKAQFEQAFGLCDIALPGVEDLEDVYGTTSVEDVLALCRAHNIGETVIKNGPGSIVTLCDDELLSHTITPIEAVVDTTSAGDAFNGVYLGARKTGSSTRQAVALAAKAAGIVIQFPGAIVPESDFLKRMG